MKKTPRDLHKLAIIKREARGFTAVVPSKKRYRRHPRHRRAYKYRTEE